MGVVQFWLKYTPTPSSSILPLVPIKRIVESCPIMTWEANNVTPRIMDMAIRGFSTSCNVDEEASEIAGHPFSLFQALGVWSIFVLRIV